MRCPKCDQKIDQPGRACPACGFLVAPTLVENWNHIQWLLAEIEAWPLSQADRQIIREKYQVRLRDLEVSLGLRLPPFTAEEAAEAWPDLIRREILLETISDWPIRPESRGMIEAYAQEQMAELQERLADHPRPDYPRTENDRLEVVNFLLEAVDYLAEQQGFPSPQAEEARRDSLRAEQVELEISLGRREPEPPPVPEPQPPEPPPPPEQEPPGPPPLPWRERLWQSLLSERTLQALLFLGIFLIFAGALSFVIWGWKDFSAPLRVAIPTGFTGFFFLMGWGVQTRTNLARSGIALIAIGALLIPIDFYTVYVNFDIPAAYWPEFWLMTSVFCLAAYIGVTLLSRTEFFGYLVGGAVGSLGLALLQVGHKLAGLSVDWRPAVLAGLALGLIILGTLFSRHPAAGRLRLFSAPFRYIALLTVGLLMPLTFGWRFIDRPTYDTLHYALTVTWWLGGFIFGWGAVYHRSRSLGLLAALSLPVAVYLAQAALFDGAGIDPAWHAFGWAWLTPLYFLAGYHLLTYEDSIIRGHGRTALAWGTILLIVAALWSLMDLSAAASSHAILCGTVMLAALLWRRPGYFYGASLLAFSTVTFTMMELNLEWGQLGVGWASLAIIHIIVALNLGVQAPIPLPNFAGPIVKAGYLIAALSLIPPLFPYQADLLAYTLGNWLALTAWGARLAHQRQPGFRLKIGLPVSFHWLTAIFLPGWVWLLFTLRRPPDAVLSVSMAVLAWGLIALSYRLGCVERRYRRPWYLVGLVVSLAAPIIAIIYAPAGLAPGGVLLLVGLLYFADAGANRQSVELAPAGLVTAWGLMLLLSRLHLSFDAVSLGLALLIALYLGLGLLVERRRSAIYTGRFLAPLYLTTHLLTLILLWRIYVRPFDRFFFDRAWTDAMQLWGAAAQLAVGVMYGFYAWGRYKERWGHLAAWLGAAGGGFLAVAYSSGRGSSATKAALLAIIYVLAERGLRYLRRQGWGAVRRRAVIRLAWRLYRRPLLAAGWAVSGIAILLALIRNLLILPGGPTQQIWAAAGLVLITGLYALSARLFRRPAWMWPATFLLFAPWTIWSNLLWRPEAPEFALSWLGLAWLLFAGGRLLPRRAYPWPRLTLIQILLPFSLLWGAAEMETSRFTFGLAIALYGLWAWLEHRRAESLKHTRFFYPALGLVPFWSAYLLAWLWPQARAEHYGLMLLAFGPAGLVAGQWLSRRVPKPELRGGYGLPAYLTGYACLIAGTLLVAHLGNLLAPVLLFDALLLAISAWLFKNPLWTYPAAALVPLALLVTLVENNVAERWYGPYLIGLAAVYLALAWLLRRLRLDRYSGGPLIVGFGLIPIGLLPSSLDQVGAVWGYGGAALLYAIAAYWLGQPLLLVAASALVIVPYAVQLHRSPLTPIYYGLALLPGALLALTGGWRLDRRLGEWTAFSWSVWQEWPQAAADRLLGWWGLPLYLLGFGLATAAPFFTDGRADLAAFNFLLLMPIYGWAAYRFRRRGWLLAVALAGHLAMIYWLAWGGWWSYHDSGQIWLRFMPVTLLTAGAALFIERYRHEGPPRQANMAGWSFPLYLLLLFDLFIGQLYGLVGTEAGLAVTLIHIGLIGLLAAVWHDPGLPYLSGGLGLIALTQWWTTTGVPLRYYAIFVGGLAFGYGLSGYGLALLRQRLAPARLLRLWLAIWELPLQRLGILLSWLALFFSSYRIFRVTSWTAMALLGMPFRQVVDTEIVLIVGWVLLLVGLFYLAAALAHRWTRLAYLALGLILLAWLLDLFYLRQWTGPKQTQWYIIPMGIYLLGLGYREWQQGHHRLSRWLDYAAILLMLGTLFWQTLLFGWNFALLLGAEGLLAVWWGSARRLRRFLYAGMGGVMLATLGQLINSLWSINQWIVFGLIGLLLVMAALLIERKLEEIKTWHDEVFDTWE